jgi:hypothetical protein
MNALMCAAGVLFSVQTPIPYKGNWLKDICVLEALVYSLTKGVEHLLLPLLPRNSGASKWLQQHVHV